MAQDLTAPGVDVSMVRGGGRIVVGLFAFWLLVLIYMSMTLYKSDDVSERAERQLTKALQELDALKRQNEQLQQLASELKDVRLLASRGGNSGCETVEKRLIEANERLQEVLEDRHKQQKNRDSGTPINVAATLGLIDNEHEYLRRKIENGIKEYWYFIKSQFSLIGNTGALNMDLSEITERATENAAQHYRVLMTDMYNLSLSGGAGDWRKREITELSDTIQNRFHHLQNPPDCSKAKKLVCSLNKGCGYGCQIHHLVYCMVVAYGTRRTMVLESHGWRYAKDGWETVFQPFSDSCVSKDGKSTRTWGPPSLIDDVQVVELPIVDSMHPRPAYMPLAIPEDIADKLTKLHGQPSVWWLGQFLKYILRPQPHLAADIEKARVNMMFDHPIVGVHVRRTDKIGTEASFHPIEEYMVQVEEYYKLLSQRETVLVKRVYLATDDPTLLADAKSKYPGYRFVSDVTFSQSAGLGSRYTDYSLRGIIMDIHFLSQSDFLVCTFSSQVCRLAYEIMQIHNPDAHNWFYSLDDIYYYGGQNAHNQQALYEHVAQDDNEISLQPGDLIGVAGNHWDGFSKGTSRRLGKTGLYPSFKVEEKVQIAKFPSYKDIDALR